MASISDIANIAMTIVVYFFIIAMIDWWVTSKKIWNLARILLVSCTYFMLVLVISMCLGFATVFWQVALGYVAYFAFIVYFGPALFDDSDNYRFSRY